jgi:hypothetical protein
MENVLLADWGLLPIAAGAAAILGSSLVLMLGWAARRSHASESDAHAKPRPVSIETELQRDVKGKWKRQKQPFIYKA